MNSEHCEKQASKYPKLRAIDKIGFIIMWPIGIAYLFYCFCIYLGIKPSPNTKGYRQKSKHPVSSYTYRYDASNPYSYTPGSYLWRSTHRS